MAVYRSPADQAKDRRFEAYMAERRAAMSKPLVAHLPAKPMPAPQHHTPLKKYRLEVERHAASMRSHRTAALMPARAQAKHDRLAQATVEGIHTPEGVPSKSPGQAMLRQHARQVAAGPPPESTPAPPKLTPQQQAGAARDAVNAILDRVAAEEAAEVARAASHPGAPDADPLIVVSVRRPARAVGGMGGCRAAGQGGSGDSVASVGGRAGRAGRVLGSPSSRIRARPSSTVRRTSSGRSCASGVSWRWRPGSG